MATDNERFEALVAAILDGRVVDWKAAESVADADELRRLQHLKVVAAVVDVHRGPDHWGHLRLLERIGSGTFGDVYRAWDPRLDREVALKLLPADRPSRDDDASLVIHEGRLLARVRHPNVVTIHGAEHIDDHVGLWMEFVRGRTLEDSLIGGRSSARPKRPASVSICAARSKPCTPQGWSIATSRPTT